MKFLRYLLKIIIKMFNVIINLYEIYNEKEINIKRFKLCDK